MASGMSALRVSRIGLPLSHDSASAMDSRFSSIRSAILFKMIARSATEVLPQAGAAACAASRASSMSSCGGTSHIAEILSGHRCRVLEVLTLDRSNPFVADPVVVSRLEGHDRVGGTWAGVHGHCKLLCKRDLPGRTHQIGDCNPTPRWGVIHNTRSCNVASTLACEKRG